MRLTSSLPNALTLKSIKGHQMDPRKDLSHLLQLNPTDVVTPTMPTASAILQLPMVRAEQGHTPRALDIFRQGRAIIAALAE